MGETMVRKSIKLPAWMIVRLEQERQRFSLFCENEADVMRLFLKIVFRMIDADMVGPIIAAMQGTLGNTSDAQGMSKGFLSTGGTETARPAGSSSSAKPGRPRSNFRKWTGGPQ